MVQRSCHIRRIYMKQWSLAPLTCQSQKEYFIVCIIDSFIKNSITTLQILKEFVQFLYGLPWVFVSMTQSYHFQLSLIYTSIWKKKSKLAMKELKITNIGRNFSRCMGLLFVTRGIQSILIAFHANSICLSWFTCME